MNNDTAILKALLNSVKALASRYKAAAQAEQRYNRMLEEKDAAIVTLLQRTESQQAQLAASTAANRDMHVALRDMTSHAKRMEHDKREALQSINKVASAKIQALTTFRDQAVGRISEQRDHIQKLQEENGRLGAALESVRSDAARSREDSYELRGRHEHLVSALQDAENRNAELQSNRDDLAARVAMLEEQAKTTEMMSFQCG
eukprot:GHVU01082555.1.p2 GENE.GHVU01082555.1~~GHVU01082555.1.p2  ORF type:complete len:203 (-),score=50.92 GHVU01082555.1:439-1047(-)